MADWHGHAGTDEVLVVLAGELLVQVFQCPTTAVVPGQSVMVPGGMVHRPRIAVRAVLLCLKRRDGYAEILAADPGRR